MKTWGMVLFCIFWDGFLVNWYRMSLGRGAPLSMILFPLIHVTAGVVLTYSTVAHLFNATIITATRRALSIRHGPVPWIGNREIQASDIEQLYCGEKVSRGRNGTSASYELCALMRDGGKVKLLSGLGEREEALFIEQRVEEQLGIADARVAGELQG